MVFPSGWLGWLCRCLFFKIEGWPCLEGMTGLKCRFVAEMGPLYIQTLLVGSCKRLIPVVFLPSPSSFFSSIVYVHSILCKKTVTLLLSSALKYHIEALGAGDIALWEIWDLDRFSQIRTWCDRWRSSYWSQPLLQGFLGWWNKPLWSNEEINGEVEMTSCQKSHKAIITVHCSEYKSRWHMFQKRWTVVKGCKVPHTSEAITGITAITIYFQVLLVLAVGCQRP